MASTEQRHRAGVLQQALAQRWQVGSGDGLEAQVHHPATALPQARAQGIAPDLGRRSAEHRSRQQLAGLGDGIEFEASAPHGANDGIGKYCHPGPRLAGHRPLRAVDRDQHARLPGQTCEKMRCMTHEILPD
jgi:hypothetical protein